MSDILDRFSRLEATPLWDPGGWEELWSVLQDARAEITRLRAKVERLQITSRERQILLAVSKAYGLNNDDPECAEFETALEALAARHAVDAAPQK